MAASIEDPSLPINEGDDDEPLIDSSDDHVCPSQDKGCCRDFGLPCRYTVSLLSFLGIFCSMNCRMCFSIALVAMVNYTDVNMNTTSNNSCPLPANDNGTSPQKHQWSGEQFDWPDWTQGLLLAAHYYGYVITQIPGGYLAERIGSKSVFAAAVLCPSALCLLIPTMARWDWRAVVAIRIVIGLSQGPLAATNSVLIGRWAPRAENTRLYVWSSTGFNAATMVASVLTGYLCDQKFLGGWPLAFYIFGSLGFFWAIPWYFLVYDSPAQHPRISEKEKMYILKTSHTSRTIGNHVVPWKAMFTSKAVWAFFLYGFFDGNASYFIASALPFYLKLLLHYDMSSNGLLNALPQLGYTIGQMLGGPMADGLRRHIPTKWTRKIFTTVGCGTAAVMFFVMSIIECDHKLPILLYSVSCIVTAIGWSGATVNHLDIAPMYAGTLMGIANSLSNTGGFIGPALLSKITHMQDNRLDWDKFFYVTCGVELCAVLCFLCLSESDIQPWAIPRDVIETTVEPCVDFVEDYPESGVESSQREGIRTSPSIKRI